MTSGLASQFERALEVQAGFAGNLHAIAINLASQVSASRTQLLGTQRLLT